MAEGEKMGCTGGEGGRWEQEIEWSVHDVFVNREKEKRNITRRWSKRIFMADLERCDFHSFQNRDPFPAKLPHLKFTLTAGCKPTLKGRSIQTLQSCMYTFMWGSCSRCTSTDSLTQTRRNNVLVLSTSFLLNYAAWLLFLVGLLEIIVQHLHVSNRM